MDVIPWNFDNHNISVENKQLKNKKIFTYHLENPQASFQVEGEPRRSKYSPHLILIPNYINNDIESIRLMNDASDLYAWYHSLVKIIGNENEILKSKVSELIDGKKTDEDKLKSIYYWVQDNIKYIAFEEGIMGFKPENCQTVYNNKYGDCKGMANLTKEMLQLAGFDARLTWIGTNDLPYTYDIPSLIVDNHMICSVMLNDKRIYLDATEKYADLYNHADRIQGKQVLIENDDDFIIEKIPFSKSEDQRRLVKNTFWIEENKLIGSGSVSYAGNQKTRILNELSSVRQKDRKNKLIKDLIKHDKNVRFATHSEVSIKNRDSNLQYNYELEVDHRIIDIENELYINLELEFPFQDFSMDDERKVPYDFRKTFYLVDLIKFKIPENHSLKYLPEKVDEKNEKYEFELSFEQIENEIIYKKKITVNNSILQVSDFAKWNETITDLNTFYADQIILEKN